MRKLLKTRLRIAILFFLGDKDFGYMNYRSQVAMNHGSYKAPEFPKYCKNIKWYPGLPDAISCGSIGEYWRSEASHYYRFKCGMIISCWEVASRKEHLEFWAVSDNDKF